MAPREKNKNAIKHGLRASALPPGCSWIEGQLRSFRRLLNDALTEKHGADGVPIVAEALVQSAVRHETRALLAQRYLRLKEAELSIEQRMAMMREIGNATDARDRCIDRLKIDAPAGFDPRTLYADAIPAPHFAPPAAPATDPH